MIFGCTFFLFSFPFLIADLFNRSLPESGAYMTKDGWSTHQIAAPIDPAWTSWEHVSDHVWFKVYQNQGLNQWNTGGYTKDFDGHTILTGWLNAGNWYSVRIAGRSTKFTVDRIIAFRCENTECAYSGLRYGIAKGYTGPQSQCGGQPAWVPPAEHGEEHEDDHEDDHEEEHHENQW